MFCFFYGAKWLLAGWLPDDKGGGSLIYFLYLELSVLDSAGGCAAFFLGKKSWVFFESTFYLSSPSTPRLSFHE